MTTFYSRTYTTGNGSQTDFTFSWEYIAAADVIVKVDGITSTAFTLADNTVTFTAAPSNGAQILLMRSTSISVIDSFSRGGTPSSGGFNDVFKRVQYIAQEIADAGTVGIGLVGSTLFDALNSRITNLADGTGASDAVNLGQLNTKQPLDATLTALAGVTTTADEVIYATGSDAFSVSSLTAFGRSLIAAANDTAVNALLGLGTAALQNVGAFLQVANNLSDLGNATTARTNLGLGALAVKSLADVADINATGTPGSGNFLRGDGSWSSPAGSGTVTSVGTSGLATGGPITGSGTVDVPAAAVSDVLTGTDTAKGVTSSALAGLWTKGADIASAATLTIPSTGGGYFKVTGTTTVTAISGDLLAGRRVCLHFAGALTLTHNATSLILPTGANITTAAGDVAEFVCIDATSHYWRCISYTRADGTPLVGGGIFTKPYTSADQTITSAGALTLAHSLGAAPEILRFTLICQTAELGYSIGQEEDPMLGYTLGGNQGLSIVCDATNINLRYGSATSAFVLTHKTTGVATGITNGNWKLRVRAWA